MPSKVNRILDELQQVTDKEVCIIDEAHEIQNDLFEGQLGDTTVLTNSQDVFKAVEEAGDN